MDTIQLNGGGRSAIIRDGLHPFQAEFNSAIEDPSNKVICVEAPVGAGKSHVARKLIESKNPNANLVVLTFPTKILMDAQIGSLREQLNRDGKDLCVWPDPDTRFREADVNLINYSTDALLKLLKREGGEKWIERPRGELLNKILDDQSSWSGKSVQAMVTTPDVLHLIAKNRYKEAKRVASRLSPHKIFVFDEFHLYYNLANFAPLVETILDDWKGRIILLSATPIAHEELQGVFERFHTKRIEFSPNSVARPNTPANDTRTFNYPLEIAIENFQTSKLDLWVDRFQKYISGLPTPMAIILDSVHRVQKLKAMLVDSGIISGSQLKEWTGIRKDSFELQENTVVIGTSAIEVGLNLPFKSLVFEATYWPSAIQRLGRAGRFCPGKIVIFSKQRFFDSVGDKSDWTRDDFEKQALMESLREPSDSLIGGEMFRGDSYAFVLVEAEKRKSIYYDQSIFAMYEVFDSVRNWANLELVDKQEVLREWRVSPEQINEILLRDKVVPLVGALKGRLRDEYIRVEYCVEKDDAIELFAGEPYVFEKKESESVPVSFDDLFDE